LIVAQTLAENGYSVLVVERGPTREVAGDPVQYKRFVGYERLYRQVNENVITRQGVRSNAGRVLSGGTAINQGIIIAETPEYFGWLNRAHGIDLDMTLINESYEYVFNRMSESPQTDSTLTGGTFDLPLDHLKEALTAEGFSPHDFHSETLFTDGWWQTYSAFNTTPGSYPTEPLNEIGVRAASDNFVDFSLPNLRIATDSTVLKVEFETPSDGSEPIAQCVLWEDTEKLDIVDQQVDYTEDPWKPAGGQLENAISKQKVAYWLLLLELSPAAPFAEYPGADSQDAQIARQIMMLQRLDAAVGGVGLHELGLERLDLPKSFGLGAGRFFPSVNELTKTDAGSAYIRRLARRLDSAASGGKIKRHRACLSDFAHAEIIMSAGAIHTPAILYKSGVGPKELIKDKYKYDLVVESPYLGKNLHDRLILPVATFIREEVRDAVTESAKTDYGKYDVLRATSAEIAGLSNFGSDCSSWEGLDNEDDTCAYVLIEENSFGHLIEGVLFQSRFIFPPSLRNSKAADTIMSYNKLCDAAVPDARFAPICKSINFQELYDCLERAAGWASIVSVPVSRGTIDLNEKGEVLVDPNYLDDPRDRRAAAEGVRKLRQLWTTVENDPTKRAIYESEDDSKNKQMCPATIFNILLSAAENIFSLFTLQSDNLVRLDMEKIINYLKAVIKDPMAAARDNTEGKPDSSRPKDPADRILYFPGLPNIEDIDDDKLMLDFYATFGTSMWHMAGTAKMGQDDDPTAVLRNDFTFKGAKRLAVIDASVFAQLTRANPAITVQALGRYAGLLRVQKNSAVSSSSTGASMPILSSLLQGGKIGG